MYISMNWIRDFVDLSGLDLNKLIAQFSLSTAEVENEIFYRAATWKVSWLLRSCPLRSIPSPRSCIC